MVAAALAGASAVSGLASGVGGFLGQQGLAGAAGTAAQEQVAAEKAAQQAISGYYNQAIGFVNPYNKAGQSAIPTIEGLLGTGPAGGAGMETTLQNLPGYQFSLQQAEQQNATSSAARGLGLSGAELRGATNYATGVANQNYSNYVSQIMGLLGLGENAGNVEAQAATTAGGETAQTAVGIGNAQAAGTIGAASAGAAGLNALTGGIGSLANAGGYYSLLNSPYGQNILNGTGGGSMYQVGAQDFGNAPTSYTQLTQPGTMTYTGP